MKQDLDVTSTRLIIRSNDEDIFQVSLLRTQFDRIGNGVFFIRVL